ncbi:class I SAM-dependent methyltransferase [Pseudoruegeria sp. SK021]|uniref:class I SAM-dependent methyltransferase n=1 Tax=Pseudoruegeria sp. SK021 TaxID=1933035 RepID=UPI000A25951F|nr:class I SAM-dependent methyltransferase [Pseudoruegeria sp. SK021]OSP55077.1 methyltransferase [Pseudoruegeria sp. SK021]
MTPRAFLEKLLRDTATVVLPLNLRRWIRQQQRLHKLQSVPVGSVDFGGLRRVSPISAVFGQDRDLLTIERYYIEDFLARHASDIKGRALEMGDPAYTRKFGGDRVMREDVLSYVDGNPLATIVADLTDAPHIPDNSFDCIIITQTLQMIFEVDKAIATLHRILKPGGVVLCTSHGMTRVARREGIDDWGEYWHFTTQSKRRLFRAAFPLENVEVTSVGNVFSCICNLHGLGASEIAPEELSMHDPNFEMLVLVRAVKGS